MHAQKSFKRVAIVHIPADNSAAFSLFEQIVEFLLWMPLSLRRFGTFRAAVGEVLLWMPLSLRRFGTFRAEVAAIGDIWTLPLSFF